MERNNICKSCNFEYWNCIRYIVESCRSLIGRVRAMTFHVTNIGASKMEEQINLSLFFPEVLWRISIFPTYLCKLSSFFLEPFTSHIEIWRRFVGGIRRIQYFSTYLDATPGALPPLSLLDFHRMHLGGLSVILSCRQLQTRRPITVSIEGVWTKARRQFLAAKLRVNVSILFSFLFNSRWRWPCRGLIDSRAINQAASIFPRKLFGLYPFENVKETSTYVCIFPWCRRDVRHAQWPSWRVCTWLNRIHTDAASTSQFHFPPVLSSETVSGYLLSADSPCVASRSWCTSYYWVGN